MSKSAAELRSEAIALVAQADSLERNEAFARQLAEYERRPKAPKLKDGEARIIAFERYLSGRGYVYAAVGWRQGSNTRWCVTATGRAEQGGRYNWQGLLKFIGEANWGTIREMLYGEPLIAPADEPAVVEQIGPYGRVAGTYDVNPFS